MPRSAQLLGALLPALAMGQDDWLMSVQPQPAPSPSMGGFGGAATPDATGDAVEQGVSSLLKDPQVNAMASALAGQAANAFVGKVQDKMAEAEVPPEECTGPECCTGSTCLDMPGMGCSDWRGVTRCVGSRAMNFHKGVCACMKGACGGDGKCAESPTEAEMQQMQQAQFQAPQVQQPQLQAPQQAPAGGAAASTASEDAGTATWSPVTQLGGVPGSRLYEARDAAPPQARSLPGAAWLLPVAAAGLAAFVARRRDRATESAGDASTEEELVE